MGITLWSGIPLLNNIMNASGAVREPKFTYLKMLYILALELPLTMNFTLYTIFPVYNTPVMKITQIYDQKAIENC